MPALAEAAKKPGDKTEVLGPGPVPLRFTLNARAAKTEAEPRETLAEVLLYRLNVTGTKVACDRGACGACTVIVDGRTRNACMTPALDVEGKKVTTVEGCARAPNELSRVQESFVAHDALQCGYCTPGFVVSACALLERNPQPTREQIADALSGNLCRCGSQPHVIAAVLDAAGGPERSQR